MLNPGAQPAWAARILKDVDLGAVAGDLRRFEQDDRWLRENLCLFRRDFPGMFIAVHDKRVVASGKTLKESREKAASAGIDPAKCVIQLVLAEDYNWVL